MLLVFTVYALSEAVEPEALVWDDLLDPSRALAVLGPQLACEGVGPGVVSHFEVQRLQEGAVRINPLPCKTHHLLVVTEGRRAGERSVQILNLGRLQHKQRLCFELQDVFEPPSRRGECAFEFEVGPHVGLEASAQRSRR